MLSVLNHPSITDSGYSTIILSWFDGTLHLFKQVPIDSGQVLLSVYYFSYFLTFLTIYLMLRHWQRNGTFKVLPYQVVDLMIVTIVGVMLGAKLFYVLFYNLEGEDQLPARPRPRRRLRRGRAALRQDGELSQW
jgi:prolipoprotein diacylglyceryltransferase